LYDKALETIDLLPEVRRNNGEGLLFRRNIFCDRGIALALSNRPADALKDATRGAELTEAS